MRRKLVFLLVSNVLLFFPVWFVNRHHSSFLPFAGIQNIHIEGLLSIFFLNHNMNPFRLAVEWTFVILAGMLILQKGKGRKIIYWLLAGIWLLFFLFQIYFSLMASLYGAKPQLSHEWVLVKEVVPIFLAGMDVNFYLVLGLLIFLLVGVWLLLVWIFKLNLKTETSTFPFRSWMMLTTLTFLFIQLSTVRYIKADIYDMRLNAQWLLPRMVHAIKSDEVQRVKNLDLRMLPYKSYLSLELQKPPNIYLIFLESYGAVAHLSPYTQDSMANYLHRVGTQLTNAGWQMNSTWSLAPIKGGRSWLSFSSVITGMNIDNQLAYNDLLNDTLRFPHLVRFLNKMGYETHRLNTMQTNEATEKRVPYEKIRDFHEFDTWTLFKDIPYTGYRYHPIGGVPDQFAFEHVYDQHIKGKNSPQFLFFITLDGHGPWYPPPPILEDYRELNRIQHSPYGAVWSLDALIMDRYRDAMCYQIGFLEQFIRTKGSSNDLFILIGDHQPPAMEWQIQDKINDFAVPVHIIHKNVALANTLNAFGFSSDMHPLPQDTIPLKHEGMYSLITHLLAKHYKDDRILLPLRYHGL